jgi:hypothetical protein
MPEDRVRGALPALTVASGILLASMLASGTAAALPKGNAVEPRPLAFASEGARRRPLETCCDLITSAPAAPRSAAGLAPRLPATARDASPAFTSRSHGRRGGALPRRVRHGRRRGRGPAQARRRPDGRRRARPSRGLRMASRSSSGLVGFARERFDSHHPPRALLQRTRSAASRRAKVSERRMARIIRGAHGRSPRLRRPRTRHAHRSRSPGRSRARGRRSRRRRSPRHRSRSRSEMDRDALRANTRPRHPARPARGASRSRDRRARRTRGTRPRIHPHADPGAVPRPGLEPAFTGGGGE